MKNKVIENNYQIYNKKKFIRLSNNQLKMIAMVTMLIDHIGLMLIGNGKLYGYSQNLYSYVIALDSAKNWLILYRMCRMIGRISFPIYTFCIVEGFLKTNNLFKYIVRLVMLAIISEIPFDMMTQNTFFSLAQQNVIWTYLIGIMMLYVFNKFGNNIFLIIIKMCAFAGACILSYKLHTDYSYVGIILMAVIYFTRFDITMRTFGVGLIGGITTIRPDYGSGVLSAIFIHFYDGTRGRINLNKLFYLFYPVHMLVLFFIEYISYMWS